ncbi:MAG: amidohydrolase [Desulfobacteraceae bacterium]|jgi:hippurate hydrolase|nr:MAG: amidohydrolase [Desulfobacteraceae bacterium]
MTNSWKQIIDAAVALRHALHRIPELSWSEARTSERIREELTTAGISWRVCAETGTVAVLAKEASGRHIALRADIDALPIQEESVAAWASETRGCMHACGHDGHAATLVAAAMWLKQQEARLPGPVSLLFQPAEEGGHGARRMIEDGAIDGVDEIYGWHNWPAIPFGRAVCPDGVVMAANGTFRVTVTGKGGHASQPELCRDPIAGASAIVLALQQIVSRRLPPQQAAVVSVTSFDATSMETVTPDCAVLAGNIRIADDGLRDMVNELIKQVATDTARAWGVKADVNIFPRYGATVNDPNAAEAMRNALLREFGSQWEDRAIAIPVMASEDFHYYANQIPGALALIGAGGDAALHNCRYDFNDVLIGPAARVMIQLAGGTVPVE